MWPLLLIGGAVALLLAGKSGGTPAQPSQPQPQPKAPAKKKAPAKGMLDETPFGGFEDPRKYRKMAHAAAKAKRMDLVKKYNRKADELNVLIRRARTGQGHAPAAIKR